MKNTPNFAEALDSLITDFIDRELVDLEEVISELELKLLALKEEIGDE